MTEKKKKMNRRDFLKLSSTAAAGALLSACVAQPAAAPQVVEKVVTVEVEKEVVKEVEVAAADPWLTGMVPPDQSGSFKIMSWEDEGEMRKFLLHIDRFFNNYYPNMEPEIEWGIPWGDYWTKLPTLMAAGTPPDMAWQHISRGEVFPSKGWSVDLTDYINQYPPDGWPDDWWEGSVDALMYQGKVYGLPYDWASDGIYVNRDIMDKITDYPVNSDWTWQDLREMAKQATSEGPDGTIFGAKLNTGSSRLNVISLAFGGFLFNEDQTEAGFDHPATIEAAQYLWDMRWKDQSMATPEQEQAAGISGEAAFVTGRVAMHQALNDNAFRFDEVIGDQFSWGLYPIPQGPEGRFVSVGNSGWFIPTGSGYPDMAYELMRYALSNPDLLPTTGTMGSSFVGRKSFWKWGLPQGEMAEKIPNYQEVFVDIPGAAQTLFPNWPGAAEWEQFYTKWTDPIFIEGDPDVEGAMAGLQKDTVEFLAISPR
jgi:multiple sugar transport system substrate-binding protein